MTRSARSWLLASPWGNGDITRTAIGLVLGGSLCIGGWASAGGQDAVEDQFAGATAASIGLLVALSVQCLWLLSARRLVGERMRAVLGHDSPSTWTPTATSTAGTLVAGEGLGRYHDSGCPIVEDDWAPASRAEHEAAGRQPCGICAP